MFVQPTTELIKRTSKQRIAPVIGSTPRLRARVSVERSRDSSNTLLVKEFDGGILVMIGANSAAGLRSMPVQYLFLDEIDAYEDDLDGEGDPYVVVLKRTNTYRSKRKVFVPSTPTIKGRSRIDSLFQRSDKRYYFLACPRCNEVQTIDFFKNIRWDKEHGEHLPKTAYMACEHCGFRIEEHHKPKLLEHGEWRSTALSKEGIHGYHLSSLYSPLGWYSWADAAQEFLNCKGEPESLKAFYNTVLGLPWEEEGEAPELETVKQLRQAIDPYIVPVDAYILTAGVDVQKDRLVFEVRAWGTNYSSWQIDHGELWGDTLYDEVWQRLDTMLDQGYDGYAIRLMLVDSGCMRDRVYDYVRNKRPRVYASKGRQSMSKPVSRSVQDVTFNGKRLPGGLELWLVDTGYFKDWVHQRLNRPTDQPGAWYLNRATTDDYCEQLISEHKIEIKPGKAIWKRRVKANHYLDTAVLNTPAAHILGIHNIRPPSADKPSGGGLAALAKQLS